MDVPKPGPFIKKVPGEDPKVEAREKNYKPITPKKPYTPEPHLTARPFKDLKTKLDK